MREMTRVGMHSRTLMEWVLRIMANLLRPDEIGPAEAAYKAAAALVRLAAATPERGADPAPDLVVTAGGVWSSVPAPRAWPPRACAPT